MRAPTQESQRAANSTAVEAAIATMPIPTSGLSHRRAGRAVAGGGAELASVRAGGWGEGGAIVPGAGSGVSGLSGVICHLAVDHNGPIHQGTGPARLGRS